LSEKSHVLSAIIIKPENGIIFSYCLTFLISPCRKTKRRRLRKILKPVSVSCFSLALLAFPASQSGSKIPNTVKGLVPDMMMQVDVPAVHHSAAIAGSNTPDAAIALYDSLQLDKAGLSPEAFQYAWKGYEKLSGWGHLRRPEVLTICDFSQSSRQKRMYIIDVVHKRVLLNTYVAHGRNSGEEYASRFSNTNDSHQSSLGFYVTGSTYSGEHGLSLRMNGMENGFNNNAAMRNIVVHGAGYIGAGYLRSANYAGRSWGCPAVPDNQKETVIGMIKNGTCFFIYHPTKNYLNNSKILNG
jgi:L,D-transpeptidase catalytic domain